MPQTLGNNTAVVVPAGGVNQAALAKPSVGTPELINGSVTLAKLASNSVDATKIVDASVGLAELAPNSVDATKIVDGSVGTAELTDGNVTLAKLASNSVDGSKIVDGSVGTAEIAANAVTQLGFAVGTTANPTTTSGIYVDLPEMTVTLTTAGGDLLVWCNGAFLHNTLSATTTLALSLDGAAEVAIREFSEMVANNIFQMVCMHRFTGVSAASHTVKGRWQTGAGQATARSTERSILVMEVKR